MVVFSRLSTRALGKCHLPSAPSVHPVPVWRARENTKTRDYRTFESAHRAQTTCAPASRRARNQAQRSAAQWLLPSDKRAEIAAASGITAVVVAMLATVPQVFLISREFSLAVLCAFLFVYAVPRIRALATNADNKARIAAAGGIDALVGAMGGHRGDAGVQGQGCVQDAGRCAQGYEAQPRDGTRGKPGRAATHQAEEAVKCAMAAAGATALTRGAAQQLLNALVNV